MIKLFFFLCVFVIIFHIVAGVMEIVRGPKMIQRLIGRLPPEAVEPVRTLLINQGVYNLFLAAGLIWALLPGMDNIRSDYAVMFLLFVAVAGLVGFLTSRSNIILIGQMLPAVVALIVFAMA